MPKKYNYNEYINQKFNYLTIIDIISQKGTGKMKQFKVKCDCGTEKLLSPHRIISGHVRSCGCQQYIGFKKHNDIIREDLVGKRFGHLIVLRKNPNHPKRHISWFCKCDCGREKILTTLSLKHDHIKSCGCKQFRQGTQHGSWKGFGELSGKEFNRIRWGAEKRNIPFNITIEQAWNKFVEQNGVCAISGQKLYFYVNGKYNNNGNASLDRIDSDKEYEISNIQWVSKTINIMKNKFSPSEFLNFCKMVVQNNTMEIQEDYCI